MLTEIIQFPQELTSKLVLVVLALAISSAIIGTAVAVPLITSADIKDETIQSVDIKNGEVKTSDLADNAVTSTKIAPGAVQLQVTQRTNVITGVNPGTTIIGGVSCNSGETAIGGGYSGFSAAIGVDKVNLVDSHRSVSTNSWQITVEYESGSSPRDITLYAECVHLTPYQPSAAMV